MISYVVLNKTKFQILEYSRNRNTRFRETRTGYFLKVICYLIVYQEMFKSLFKCTL